MEVEDNIQWHPAFCSAMETGDSENANTFYKALCYACLYKAESDSAEECLAADITVSLVREQKPVKLLKQLNERYQVIRRADGIYRSNGTLFPMQILVGNELSKKSHIWVASLTRTMEKERAEMLLDSYFCAYG